MTTAGDALSQSGMAAHVYAFNTDMTDDYFFNADGEMLIVPEAGTIRIFTELGIMDIEPAEICVVPRGMIFKAALKDCDAARGYICENYGAKFTMPDRGPIGANCLANPRDFKTPVAAYEDKDGTACRLTVKWCGSFHSTPLEHSPLDVVAWHGNYTPCKYDLRTFSPVGAILFDHPDPSIFTVLTAPSGEEGTANVDFVIFPPRWLVAEHTFRPPWYHRNIMSEFMGLVYGQYDAKEEGFVPGGMSLHNLMLPHGPDFTGFKKATGRPLGPVKLDNTMAFMFETRFPQQLTQYAADLDTLQDDYIDCWIGLERKFDGTPGEK
ncbi:MAG: homogentisate 1,2-dioxygenase, partial [Rhizobiaceae bacterium]